MAQTVNSILDVETMLSLATIDPEFENVCFEIP